MRDMTDLANYSYDQLTLDRANYFMQYYFRAGYEHLTMSTYLSNVQVVLFLHDKDALNKVYKKWHALIIDDEEIKMDDLSDKDSQLYIIQWSRNFKNTNKQ